MFIKTACCFPERITKEHYDSVLTELQHSEKVNFYFFISSTNQNYFYEKISVLLLSSNLNGELLNL